MKIIRAALERSLLMNLITIIVLVGGVLATMNMRREAFPAVDFDVVSVSAVYPGASPREMEKYIASPIVREIKKVDGIKKIDTRNIEGVMLMTVTLDPDLTRSEKDRAINYIQQGVDGITDLPEDLLFPPIVREIDSSFIPVVEVAISGDMPYEDLYDHARKLKKMYEDLPDVSGTFRWGYREREYRVVVDPDKMRALGLSFIDLSRALKSSNITLPGGSIDGPHGEILVRTYGEVHNAREIGEVVIRANDADDTIRIHDVATVKKTFAERFQFHKSDGTEAILMKVKKTRGGDIIELVNQVKQVSDFAPTRLTDFSVLTAIP